MRRLTMPLRLETVFVVMCRDHSLSPYPECFWMLADWSTGCATANFFTASDACGAVLGVRVPHD